MNARTGPLRPPSTGMSRRSFLSAAMLGGAAATLSACASPIASAQSAADGPDMLIGACLEMSGLSAAIGQNQKAAIDVAIDSVNQNGFVVGGLSRRLRLVSLLDNQSNPAVAAKNMKQLVSIPGISAVVGPGTGAVAEAMAELADEDKVPMLTMASAGGYDMFLSRRLYTYLLGPRSSHVAQLIARAMQMKAPHASNITVIHTDDVYGGDGWTAMQGALAPSGANLTEIKTKAPAGSGPPTFNNAARAVVASKPDAVVIWALTPICGFIAQALEAAGYTGKLFFDSGAASDETISGTNHRAVLGGYLVAPSLLSGPPLAVTDPATLQRRDFYQSYIATNQVFSGLAPSGGDSILLAVQAAITVGTVNPTDIRDTLESMHFQGIAGDYTFAANDHSGLNGDSLAVFRIGQAGWESTDVPPLPPAAVS